LPGTLAPTVLRIAASGGDATLYERYLAQIKRPGLQPEEYYRFFNALASFRDPALVTRTLQFALSNDVRTQDTGTLLEQILGSPSGRELAWQFIQKQWQTIIEKLGTFQGIPSIARGVQSFCSTERAGEIRQFFTKNRIASSERTVQQSIERIGTCAAVQARQAPALTAWLMTAR
jgi:aminopeptidase N